jgi:hypothetical protein
MHASSVHVTLKVYDVLGREVATLVNDEKPAGSYSVTFNVEAVSKVIFTDKKLCF